MAKSPAVVKEKQPQSTKHKFVPRKRRISVRARPKEWMSEKELEKYSVYKNGSGALVMKKVHQGPLTLGFDW